MNVQWRVELFDRDGQLSGDWTNFPNEGRARAFAADRIKHEMAIVTVKISIVYEGGQNERP